MSRSRWIAALAGILVMLAPGCGGGSGGRGGGEGQQGPAPTPTPTPTPSPTPTPTPTPTPPPSSGDVVFVPAGDFLMGSNGGLSNERPAHTVYLGAFWIDRTEVTVAAYRDCVDSGDCSEPTTGGDCNWGVPARRDHPVNCVSWKDARAYCTWAGKRLPSEAEWEKAARGTDGRSYPWGEAPPTCQFAVMNDGLDGCGEDSTWPVGSKPDGVSLYGALDMTGNVWEWVADWYDEDYYPASPSANPRGPSNGQYRVLRGGGWSYSVPSSYLRCSFRNKGYPTYGGSSFGLRCAETASP